MFKILIIAAPELCKNDFLGRISRLCEAGADEILLRAKYLDERDFRDLAIKTSEICTKFEKKFIINQFFNVACELKSSFWMSLEQLKFLNSSTLIENLNPFGLSLKSLLNFKNENLNAKIYAPAHSLKEAKISAKFADILIASHIFNTNCKADLKPKGLSLITEILNELNRAEIYALGGINERNFSSCLKAGASGICLMSSAMSCENELKFIQNFKNL